MRDDTRTPRDGKDPPAIRHLRLRVSAPTTPPPKRRVPAVRPDVHARGASEARTATPRTPAPSLGRGPASPTRCVSAKRASFRVAESHRLRRPRDPPCASPSASPSSLYRPSSDALTCPMRGAEGSERSPPSLRARAWSASEPPCSRAIRRYGVSPRDAEDVAQNAMSDAWLLLGSLHGVPMARTAHRAPTLALRRGAHRRRHRSRRKPTEPPDNIPWRDMAAVADRARGSCGSSFTASNRVETSLVNGLAQGETSERAASRMRMVAPVLDEDPNSSPQVLRQRLAGCVDSALAPPTALPYPTWHAALSRCSVADNPLFFGLYRRDASGR